MNEQDLLNIIIPTAAISGSGVNSSASFHLEKDGEVWYLAGKAPGPNGEVSDRVLLEPEDIIDVLDGTLDIDQYCQDEAFRQHMETLAQRLGGKLTETTSRNRSAKQLVQTPVRSVKSAPSTLRKSRPPPVSNCNGSRSTGRV